LCGRHGNTHRQGQEQFQEVLHLISQLLSGLMVVKARLSG